MTNTVSAKYSISLPFAANLMGVGSRCRPSAIFCGKIVIEVLVSIMKFTSFGLVLCSNLKKMGIVGC